jgi:phosphoribosylaminoimidazolecarboxamide formyltransferase / IMP cyclohydrolase
VPLQQRRNDAKIDAKSFDNIVSKSKDVPSHFTHIGPQWLNTCDQLPKSAVTDLMHHHPRVLALLFKKGVKRADKANVIDLFVSGEVLEGG